MLSLITGLPGHGKTLYAISYIKAYAEKEGREVFYSGIKDLTLPWTEVKPEEWMTLPTGAIIVIDEAQFVFPKKPNGSKLPEYYEKLAVHRHSGYDIFLITQHPTLLDNFVRQLVGRHLHVIRKFGFHRANVWEYQTACAAPQIASNQKSAVLHKFKYPKEIYGYYKSAELHTVKRSVPLKIILAAIFVVAAPLYAYYQFNKPKQVAAQKNEQPLDLVQQSSAGKASYADALVDAKQFIYERTPRIEGLAHTAPRYDDVTKPVTAPVPVSCVSSKTRCSCYSQQGTAMNVLEVTCRSIVQRGFFVDFKATPDQPVPPPNFNDAYLVRAGSVPVVPDRTGEVAAPAADDAKGYGVLGQRRDEIRRPAF